MAYRKLYPQIFIPTKLFSQNFDSYINAWNAQFWDKDGAFKRKGARIIGDGEIRILQALKYILIDRISLKNRQNKQSLHSKVINVTKPIEFIVNTNDIRNIILKNKKKSLSLNTVKNRLEKLEEAGFIHRKFLKSKNGYLMHFSQFLLPIMDEEKGKLLKNTNFLNTVNQDIAIHYNQDLANYSNNIIKKEIKKEQLNIVDKDNGASTKNTTSTPEQPKIPRPTEAIKTIPTVQTKKYSKKIARIFNLSKEQTKDIAQDLQNNLLENQEAHKTLQKTNNTKHQKKQFEILRNNFARAFYTRFIITFFAHMRNNYLPDTAGIKTIFYVEQAINEVKTDKDFYFGACKTIEHLQYQAMKLEKALKSTLLNYQKNLKKNPYYNWTFNYPNQFLSKPPGKNSFSFKNSILHIEKSMINTNKLNVEYEKQMTEHKIKLLKEAQQKIIYSAIWYIYQNTSRIKTNINVALEYFKDDTELRNNFKSLILNSYAVKKWLLENKKFEPDQILINECFIRQQILEKEINELLPDFHKKIRYSEKTRKNIGKYFLLSGDDYTPVPRYFNQKTYDFIHNFVN